MANLGPAESSAPSLDIVFERLTSALDEAVNETAQDLDRALHFERFALELKSWKVEVSSLTSNLALDELPHPEVRLLVRSALIEALRCTNTIRQDRVGQENHGTEPLVLRLEDAFGRLNELAGVIHTRPYADSEELPEVATPHAVQTSQVERGLRTRLRESRKKGLTALETMFAFSSSLARLMKAGDGIILQKIDNDSASSVFGGGSRGSATSSESLPSTSRSMDTDASSISSSRSHSIESVAEPSARIPSVRPTPRIPDRTVPEAKSSLLMPLVQPTSLFNPGTLPWQAEQDLDMLYPKLGFNHDTRLIDLKQSDGATSIISCQSKAVALHDDLQYVALSYNWGRHDEKEAILLNGCKLLVRRALWEALKVLRARNVGRVWIDYLCINQDDDMEQERQISKMSVIYSHASEVFVWLGRQHMYSPAEPDDAEFGVNWLGRPLSTPVPQNKEVQAVQAVIKRPYWKSCWIVQDICVARKITILCGDSEADFSILWENLRGLTRSPTFPYVEPEVMEHLDYLGDFHEQENAKCRKARMPLVEALLKSRNSRSSQPRDKIYALLKLSHDGAKLVDTPNYSQPDAVICWKLAHNMIHLQGHTAIVLLARREATVAWRVQPSATTALTDNHTRRRRHSRMTSADLETADIVLPTWVPYWPALDASLPEWIIQSVLWCDEESNAPAATTHHGQTLCLRGWLLDEIVSLSGCPGLMRHPAPEPNEPLEDNLTPRSVVTREAANTDKLFETPDNVFIKLRSTLLAPLFKQSSIPQHECPVRGCGGHSVPGLAFATVLGNTADCDLQIRRWWETNKGFVVGELQLATWVKEIIASNATYRVACDLGQEIMHLSEALSIMQKHQMRLAVTDKGTFRLVYCEAGVGDVVCRVEQCVLPIVLRPSWDLQHWIKQPNEHAKIPTPKIDEDIESDDRAAPSAPHEELCYKYVGEAYRHDYLKDVDWLGWKRTHVAPDQLRDFWIR